MKIFKKLPREKRLYIDIETVAAVKELDPEIHAAMFGSWEYKHRYAEQKYDSSDIFKFFEEKAALFAEFGKIVCISLGYFKGDDFRVSSIFGDDEETVLRDFKKVLNKFAGSHESTPDGKDIGRGIDIFTGFSIKEFDLNYLFKRMVINGIKVHNLIDYSDIKPWELDAQILDLKHVWKGTSWNTSSLINVTTALGLPSPKDVINGSEVSALYWSDGPREEILDTIKTYCEKDVVAVMQCIDKMENGLT